MSFIDNVCVLSISDIKGEDDSGGLEGYLKSNFKSDHERLLHFFDRIAEKHMDLLVASLMTWRNGEYSSKKAVSGSDRGDKDAHMSASADRKMLVIDYLFCELVLLSLRHWGSTQKLTDTNVEYLSRHAFQQVKTGASPFRSKWEKDCERSIADLYSEILAAISSRKFSHISAMLLEDILRATKSKALPPDMLLALVGCRSVTPKFSVPEFKDFVGQIYQCLILKKQKNEFRQALWEFLASLLTNVETAYSCASSIGPQCGDLLVQLWCKVDDMAKKLPNKMVPAIVQTAILGLSPRSIWEKYHSGLLETLIKSARPGEKTRTVALECLFRFTYFLVHRLEGDGLPGEPILKRIITDCVVGVKRQTMHEECVDILVDLVNLISIKHSALAVQSAVLPSITASQLSDLSVERAALGLQSLAAILTRLGFYSSSSVRFSPCFSFHVNTPLKSLALTQSLALEMQRMQPIGTRPPSATVSNLGGPLVNSQPFALRSSQANSATTGLDSSLPHVVRLRKAVMHAYARANPPPEHFVVEAITIFCGKALFDLLNLLHGLCAGATSTQLRTLSDAIGKEKLFALDVLPYALNCCSKTIPLGMSVQEMVSQLIHYMFHLDEKTRHTAKEVLVATFLLRPTMRSLIVQEVVVKIVSLPEECMHTVPFLISCLYEILAHWLAAVSTNSNPADDEVKSTGLMPSAFPSNDIDLLCLILLCSSDLELRRWAFLLVAVVGDLQAALENTKPTMLKTFRENEENAVAGALLNYYKLHGFVEEITFNPPNWREQPASFQEVGLHTNNAHTQGTMKHFVPKPFLHDPNLEDLSQKPDEHLAWTYCLGQMCVFLSRDNPTLTTRMLSFLTSHVPDILALIDSRKDKDASVYIILRNYLVAGAALTAQEDATASTAGELIVTLHRKDNDMMVDAMRHALCFLNPAGFRDVLQEILRSESDTSLLTEASHKARKDIGKVESARCIRLLACVMHTRAGCGHWEACIPLLAQFLKSTHQYLQHPANDLEWNLMDLRFDFLAICYWSARALCHSSLDPTKAGYPPEFRQALFEFGLRYCGHGRVSTDQKEKDKKVIDAVFDRKKAAALKNKKDMRKRMEWRVRMVEHYSSLCMQELILGPPFPSDMFLIPEPSMIEEALVQQWVLSLLMCNRPEVDRIAIDSLYRYYKGASPAEQEKLLTIFVHHSYNHDPHIAQGFFIALSRVLTTTDPLPLPEVRAYTDLEKRDQPSHLPSLEVPDLPALQMPNTPSCNLPVLMILGLYKLSDRRDEVRYAAVSLLHVVCNAAFATTGGDHYHLCGQLGTIEAYVRQQMEVSAALAKDRPEITFILMDEAYSRLPKLNSSEQRKILSFLPPWLENLFLIQPPSQERSAKVLKDLCMLTLKHMEDPVVIDRLWAALAKSLDNVVPILSFLFERNELQNPLVLKIAKRVAVSLAKLHPEVVVSLLREELFYGLNSRTTLTLLPQPQSVPDSVPAYIDPSWDLDVSVVTMPTDMPIDRCGFSVVLLPEVCMEARSLALPHIHTLITAAVVSMDHPNPAVHIAAQNLVSNMVFMHLRAQGRKPEDLRGWRELICLLKREDGKQVWRSEFANKPSERLDSEGLLEKLVEVVLVLISTDTADVRPDWGDVVAHWVSASPSLPHVCRCCQLYRALAPEASELAISCVFQRLLDSFTLEPASQRSVGLSRVVVELFSTVLDMTRRSNVGVLTRHPLLLWGSIALLHSDKMEDYVAALDIVKEQLTLLENNWDLNDELLGLLEAALARNLWPTPFTGVQPLLLRGVFLGQPAGEQALKMLFNLATFPETDFVCHSPSERWATFLVVAIPVLFTNFALEESRTAAKRLGLVMAKLGYSALADVFLSEYPLLTNRTLETTMQRLASAYADEFFERHELLSFALVAEMIKKGDPRYQPASLLFFQKLQSTAPPSSPMFSKKACGLLSFVALPFTNPEEWGLAARACAGVITVCPLEDIQIKRCTEPQIADKLKDTQKPFVKDKVDDLHTAIRVCLQSWKHEKSRIVKASPSRRFSSQRIKNMDTQFVTNSQGFRADQGGSRVSLTSSQPTVLNSPVVASRSSSLAMSVSLPASSNAPTKPSSPRSSLHPSSSASKKGSRSFLAGKQAKSKGSKTDSTSPSGSIIKMGAARSPDDREKEGGKERDEKERRVRLEKRKSGSSNSNSRVRGRPPHLLARQNSFTTDDIDDKVTHKHDVKVSTHFTAEDVPMRRMPFKMGASHRVAPP